MHRPVHIIRRITLRLRAVYSPASIEIKRREGSIQIVQMVLPLVSLVQVCALSRVWTG